MERLASGAIRRVLGMGLFALAIVAHGNDGTARAGPPPTVTDSISHEVGTALPPPSAVAPSAAVASALFFIYQRGVAQGRGLRCPMDPSCSEYGRIACMRFGVLRGTMMAVDRISRCGHDEQRYPPAHMARHFRLWDPVPVKLSR